jgi:hypothetical protein
MHFLTPCNHVINGQEKQNSENFPTSCDTVSFCSSAQARIVIFTVSGLPVTHYKRGGDKYRTNLISVWEGKLKWLSSRCLCWHLQWRAAFYCRMATCRKLPLYTAISFTFANFFVLHCADVRGRRSLRNFIELETSFFIRNMAHFLVNMFMYLDRANWHTSATLTEGFRAFSSVVRQMPGYDPQRRGTARTLPNSLRCSVYCLCVNVYCTAATGWLPNCS